MCRYVDICLGLSLLLSHLLLSYGSVQESRYTITFFFILSMAVLILYWMWFAYLKYGKMESEASKKVKQISFTAMIKLSLANSSFSFASPSMLLLDLTTLACSSHSVC